MRAEGRRFLKNGVCLALAALLMRTVSVSFGAYVSERIGASGMGLYSLIMSVYTLAVTFATSGVQLATTRLVSEALGRGDAGGARAALRLAVRYALSCGTLAAVILFLGAPFFGGVILSDTRTIPSLRLLAVALVPIALSSVFSGYFTAVRRPSRAAGISVLEQAIRILLTVYLLTALLPAGLTYACLALVGGSAIAEILSAAFLGVLYLFDRKSIAKCGGKKLPVRSFLYITAPVAASSYIRSGLVSAEHILIPRALARGGQGREEALASYGTLSGMSLTVALYPMAVLSAFAGLLVPEFAERAANGKAEENRRLCERTLTLALWFGLGIGGLLAAFAVPLAEAIYESREAGFYLALLAPIIPVMYLDHVTDVMLKGLGRQVYAMGVNILDSMGSILLVLLLLPRYGAAGYVLVIAIAEIFNFALSLSGLYRVLFFRFPLCHAVLFPMAAVLTAVTLVRRFLTISGILGLILSLLLAAALYLLILFLLLRADAVKKKKAPLLDTGASFGYNSCIYGRLQGEKGEKNGKLLLYGAPSASVGGGGRPPDCPA